MAIVLYAASIGGSTIAEAGSVGTSVEKSIARRIAKRSEVTTLTRSEQAALAGIWRDLDEKALVAIERRYGSQIGAKRLNNAKQTPTTITDRATFDKHLRERDPTMTEAQRNDVLGYYFDGKTNVNGNQVELPLTVAHERLHQLAHPRFRETLGGTLDEGMTELMAREIYRDMHLIDTAKVYPAEQQVARMLSARVGETPLARAYFQGDIAVLRQHLDADLGTGSFERLARALRARDMESATTLLIGRSP